MGNAKTICALATGTMMSLSLASGALAGGGMDEKMLMELKQLIEQQQQQLDVQAGEIAQLKEQLGGATQEIEKKADKEEVAKLQTDKMVTSRFKHVDVNLYGHLNRGILWSDNGDASKVYFVDNNNSMSRLGLNASVSPSDNFTVGGKIEYGIRTNSSGDVNQLNSNGATSNTWLLRHADVFFSGTTWGKIFLGHGSSASDGTAEVDLSGTSVVAYSDMEALSGGQLWYDGLSNSLSSLQVKNVFSNMDGLGRDDRLRYDTPAFAGFTFSTSAVSGDAYDAAIKYSRAFGDTKVAAAIAWAKPDETNDSVENQYDGSVSVLLGNGLNATFAAGSMDSKADGRDDATFWYTKLGYRVGACSLGTTSFSIDYGENKDLIENNDTAKTWAFAAVQDIESWGTELYIAYRNYQLDSDGTSYEDVNSILGGARVKF